MEKTKPHRVITPEEFERIKKLLPHMSVDDFLAMKEDCPYIRYPTNKCIFDDSKYCMKYRRILPSKNIDMESCIRHWLTSRYMHLHLFTHK